MHKNVGLGILLGGGALLATAVAYRSDDRGAAPPSDDEDRPRLTIPAGGAYVPPSPPPPPPPRSLLAAKAAEWRARADGDAALIDRLGQRLLAARGAPEVCQMIALVLGSLNDSRAAATLRRALSEGSGASRSSVMYALALDREGPAADIFWRTDGPGVISTEGGFRIRLRRVIQDPDLRRRMNALLLDSQLEVRQAAYRVLEGSIQYEDVRADMLRAFEEETDAGLLELLAFTLARWAGGAQAEDPVKHRIVAAILDRADEEAVRHGSRSGLQRAHLTPDERVQIMMVGGAWADEVLGIDDPLK